MKIRGENLYEIIAVKMRNEKKRLCISQIQLAKRADSSLDTVKSVERGRRAMSLDTYFHIVQALETTPKALLHGKHYKEYLERFAYITVERSHKEMEFVLYYVETVVKRTGGLFSKLICLFDIMDVAVNSVECGLLFLQLWVIFLNRVYLSKTLVCWDSYFLRQGP